jgi:hypothetical protein
LTHFGGYSSETVVGVFISLRLFPFYPAGAFAVPIRCLQLSKGGACDLCVLHSFQPLDQCFPVFSVQNGQPLPLDRHELHRLQCFCSDHAITPVAPNFARCWGSPQTKRSLLCPVYHKTRPWPPCAYLRKAARGNIRLAHGRIGAVLTVYAVLRKPLETRCINDCDLAAGIVLKTPSTPSKRATRWGSSAAHSARRKQYCQPSRALAVEELDNPEGLAYFSWKLSTSV